MDYHQVIKKYYRSFKEADKPMLRKILTADFRHLSEFGIYTDRDEMIEEIWPDVGKSWAEDLQIMGTHPNFMVRYKIVGGNRPVRNMAEYIRFNENKIAEIEVYLGRELE